MRTTVRGTRYARERRARAQLQDGREGNFCPQVPRLNGVVYEDYRYDPHSGRMCATVDSIPSLLLPEVMNLFFLPKRFRHKKGAKECVHCEAKREQATLRDERDEQRWGASCELNVSNWVLYRQRLVFEAFSQRQPANVERGRGACFRATN